MLSLNLLRKEHDTIRHGLANRGEDPGIVALALDQDRHLGSPYAQQAERNLARVREQADRAGSDRR